MSTSDQIPLTTDRPGVSWKSIGMDEDGAALYEHRLTGKQVRYRMQPKPIHECPAAQPPPFADRQEQARTRALAEHSELKRSMRAAAKKRRLSEWAERAGLKMPWCSKFAHGRIKFPDPDHVKRLQRFARDFS